MIFVTIGTGEPFDRLVQAAGRLPGDEELLIQRGDSSVEPARGSCADFMPFDELVAHIRRARVVVMHAGAGSVLAALAEGKLPLVVPRRRCFGEAVDDHQLWFARHLARAGLVRLVEDPDRLAEALPEAYEPPVAPRLGASGLVTELRSYLSDTVGATSTPLAADSR
jgi:UDP-N-acetylglucosamine transferase subunit ALG13